MLLIGLFIELLMLDGIGNMMIIVLLVTKVMMKMVIKKMIMVMIRTIIMITNG